MGNGFLDVFNAVAYTMRVISVGVDAMKDELSWSVYDQGLILSSFFWGYAIGQIL